MTTPQHSRRSITGLDWVVFVGAFIGAFLVAFSLTMNSSTVRTAILGAGIMGLLIVAILLIRLLRERAAETAERQRWASFERALEDGVRFEVPEGMGYAPELPALLSDLSEDGEPVDGRARNAIVGEQDRIHWCAFQHHRDNGVATVGMIGLHPDRRADSYPRLVVCVRDPRASNFDDRFDVRCADDGFTYRALNADVQHLLMQSEPFDWRVEGNQIVTTLDEPSTPEEQVSFIRERVEPLARVAGLIPLDA